MLKTISLLLAATLLACPAIAQSGKRFRLPTLPKGRNRLRTFMTVNQAGSGYFSSMSPVLTFRRG